MSEALAGLPNAQLLARVRELVRRGNAVEAELLVHLAEVDARQLYLEEGCSSMFTYCQRVLHFAEGVAYKRIQAARAARRHPQILEALRSGDLHLTAVGLLAPKLTANNCAELICAARHLGADEIRRMLADREPKPAAPTFVRRVAEPTPKPLVPALAAQPAPPPPPVPPPSPQPRTEPLGAERYRVQFTADRELYAQLEELRALMRHQIPDGDIGKIVAKAVSSLLKQVRKQKFADTSSPRPTSPPNKDPSRHIPSAIRRAVWQRDGGRCTYVSAGGRRCDSNEFVEFDHVDGWSDTRAHSIAAITLRCRAHNQLRARKDFGDRHMARFRRTGSKSDLNPAQRDGEVPIALLAAGNRRCAPGICGQVEVPAGGSHCALLSYSDLVRCSRSNARGNIVRAWTSSRASQPGSQSTRPCSPASRRSSRWQGWC